MRPFSAQRQEIIAAHDLADDAVVAKVVALIDTDAAKAAAFCREVIVGGIADEGLDPGDPWHDGLSCALIKATGRTGSAPMLQALTAALAELRAREDELPWEYYPFVALAELCLARRDAAVLPVVELLIDGDAPSTLDQPDREALAFLYCELAPAKAAAFAATRAGDANKTRRGAAIAAMAALGGDAGLARVEALAAGADDDDAEAALSALARKAPAAARRQLDRFLDPAGGRTWNPLWAVGAHALGALSGPGRSAAFAQFLEGALRADALSLTRSLFAQALHVRAPLSRSQLAPLLPLAAAQPWPTRLYPQILLLAQRDVTPEEAEVDALFDALGKTSARESFDYRDLAAGVYVLARRTPRGHAREARLLRFFKHLCHAEADGTGYERGFYDTALLLWRERTGERLPTIFGDEPRLDPACAALELPQA